MQSRLALWDIPHSLWSQPQLVQVNHKHDTWRSLLCLLLFMLLIYPWLVSVTPDLMERAAGPSCAHWSMGLPHAGSLRCGARMRLATSWAGHQLSGIRLPGDLPTARPGHHERRSRLLSCCDSCQQGPLLLRLRVTFQWKHCRTLDIFNVCVGGGSSDHQ